MFSACMSNPVTGTLAALTRIDTKGTNDNRRLAQGSKKPSETIPNNSKLTQKQKPPYCHKWLIQYTNDNFVRTSVFADMCILSIVMLCFTILNLDKNVSWNISGLAGGELKIQGVE